ncbi:MAG: tetratricopeptide repeat protein [Phycisphaerae bacterium]
MISRVGWMKWLALSGPLMLFAAACAWGVLEVHSSTDTWIGLAAGKQIVELGRVPINDTFSFTFQGEPWYNQNWLSHLYLYWLFTSLGPDWVIYGTWAVGVGIFACSLAACWLRSGSLIGAIVVAAVVAFGCRDFLSARPATVQFFCVALLWLLVCALESQGERRRWWPIVALVPLMLVWGAAHGSFVFGYAVLCLYVGHWLVMGVLAGKFLNDSPLAFLRAAISTPQALAIVGLIVACALLTLLFGPFGIHNFVHPEKVAGSDVWRQVGEWHKPFPMWEKSVYPPVRRFWLILGGSVFVLSALGVVYVLTLPVAADLKSRKRDDDTDANDDAARYRWSLMDLGMLIIGLAMPLFARRFAPMFFIFAAPVMLIWIVELTRNVAPQLRAWAALGIQLACLPAAIGLGAYTYSIAYDEIYTKVDRMLPEANLLERVTRYDATPHEAIMFLRNNDLPVNLMVEWTQGGPVMFYSPNAKLYMDGRAQQVYDELTYQTYQQMMRQQPFPNEATRLALFDGYMMDGKPSGDPPTDAVLLRLSQRTTPVLRTLESSGRWITVYLRYGHSTIMMRVDSDGFRKLRERIREGSARYPDTAESLAMQAGIWMTMQPPDFERGLELHQQAIEKSPRMGSVCYGSMANALLAQGKLERAKKFVAEERVRVGALQVDDETRKNLIGTLDAVEKFINQARKTPAQPRTQPAPPP